jgi:hypothetical protein
MRLMRAATSLSLELLSPTDRRSTFVRSQSKRENIARLRHVLDDER